jgi:hypothetical protein
LLSPGGEALKGAAAMELIRKAIVLPQASLEGAAGAVTALAFLWLLARGTLEPIAVYLLELYLSF